MDFVPAIKSGFQNYVNFSGRSCRSAYWFWLLFTFIVSIVANILDIALLSALGLPILGLLWSLAIILPSIAVGVRRLHDLDKSGWWILIGFIPIIGWIIFIIWACTKGTDGANRFGPDPLGGVAAAPAAP